MISVIIPVYNTPKELKKCLRSLERQTFKDFEVVVVDDGSTRPVEVVAASFKAQISSLKFFKIEHAGAPKARNFGFSKSIGELILFCDADMQLAPHCLGKMKHILETNSDIDFVYADFKYGWKNFRFWEFDAHKLKKINYINTCSMLRRSVVVEWDESLKKFQDWDFWLAIVERGGRGMHIPEILFKASAKRGKISFWLPKIVYKLPICQKFNHLKEYEKWKHRVLSKHKII